MDTLGTTPGPRFLSPYGPPVYSRNCISCAAAPDLSLATYVPQGQTGGRDRRSGDGTRDGGREAVNCLQASFYCAHSEQSPVVMTGGFGMCDKCQELEKKIERYRGIVFSINDGATFDQFNPLIKDPEAEKAKLHPQQ